MLRTIAKQQSTTHTGGHEVINRQFLLAERPHGAIQEHHLRYNEADLPELTSGQMLVQVEYYSLDPSMKGQMEASVSYAAGIPIGGVMRGRGVGRVIASRNAVVPVGAQAFGFFGMQDFAVCTGDEPHFHVFDPPVNPQAALGVLGGTGMTAYFGLLDIGKPQPGDTLLVSGAAGATGSVAGQIGRIKGCRVIGVAGTAEKCAWLVEELGFDGAINYRQDDLTSALDVLCPDGIDVFFDNVGGDILDLALARLKLHARVVLCGGISRYELTGKPTGPGNYFNLVLTRSRMEGFLLSDYLSRFDEARGDLRAWFESGALKQRATVYEGFRSLPTALVALFQGANTGKMLVRSDLQLEAPQP